MALTPNSSATSYLSASGLLAYYDARTVGDLCSDTGSRLTVEQIIGPPPNATVQQLLLSASGMLEFACMKGERYAAADLAALTGASLAYLQQLVADLWIGLAVRRRPDRKLPLPSQHAQALEALQALADGERVFSFLEVEEAGVPSVYQETDSDVWRRDLIETQARRFFGRRCDQDPFFPWP